MFLIVKVKYVSNDELVPRIKDCIKNKCKYDFKRYKLDSIQTMDDNNLKKVIPLIIQSMDKINYNYKYDTNDIMKYIDERNLPFQIICML